MSFTMAFTATDHPRHSSLGSERMWMGCTCTHNVVCIINWCHQGGIEEIYGAITSMCAMEKLIEIVIMNILLLPGIIYSYNLMGAVYYDNSPGMDKQDLSLMCCGVSARAVLWEEGLLWRVLLGV